MRGCPFHGAMRALGALLCSALTCTAQAGSMQPLADGELAAVSGADGLAFNLAGFSLSGPLALTYTSPDGASLALGNLALSRSDDPAATFSDPYRLRVVSRGSGLADAIVLSEPANANGALKWQFAADWTVNADGIDHQGGALVLTDLVSRAGSLTITTPADPGVEGVAFGLGLHLDVGQVLLRPRGRSDGTEQLAIGGLHLSAAAADGTLLGTPWAVADATTQPGILNATTDPDGSSHLHVGIGWPTAAAGAPVGALVIDSIVFKSDALPGGQLDLGSSRIGAMQIQYLDVKLRSGL